MNLRCPHCSGLDVFAVIYGYPNPNQHGSEWVCGGEAVEGAVFTHFCFECSKGWCDENSDPLYSPFPNDCHFCGSNLSDKDKFVFQTEFESWLDQHESVFRLEHETFSDIPYPVCSVCREEIHANQASILDENEFNERTRKIGAKVFTCVLIGLGIIFVLSIISSLYSGGAG